MTVYTFKAFHFILNHHFTGLLHRFVASGASYFGVFPIQLECRLIMVEFDGFPVVKSMASHTIRDTIFFKLLPVHVFVTGGASGRRIGKLLESLGELAHIVFFTVASHAGLIGMSALQSEFC